MPDCVHDGVLASQIHHNLRVSRMIDELEPNRPSNKRWMAIATRLFDRRHNDSCCIDGQRRPEALASCHIPGGKHQ
jgi:hypothetical protein